MKKRKYDELEGICKAVIADKVDFIMAARQASKTQGKTAKENEEQEKPIYEEFYAYKYSPRDLKRIAIEGKYPMFSSKAQKDKAVKEKAKSIDENNGVSFEFNQELGDKINGLNKIKENVK